MSMRTQADNGTEADETSVSAPDAPRRRRALRWLVRASAGAGALVGAWACYRFGIQVSGVLLGVVAGINGAVFGALMAGALADQLLSRLSRH